MRDLVNHFVQISALARQYSYYTGIQTPKKLPWTKQWWHTRNDTNTEVKYTATKLSTRPNRRSHAPSPYSMSCHKSHNLTIRWETWSTVCYRWRNSSDQWLFGLTKIGCYFQLDSYRTFSFFALVGYWTPLIAYGLQQTDAFTNSECLFLCFLRFILHLPGTMAYGMSKGWGRRSHCGIVIIASKLPRLRATM